MSLPILEKYQREHSQEHTVAPTTTTRAYNTNTPGVDQALNEKFPILFAPKSSKQAGLEIHEYNSYFHTVQERNTARQLLEEGRIELEQIESVGLPESFGELVRSITHPFSTGIPGGYGVNTSKGKPGEPPKGTPTHLYGESASESGEKEAPHIPNPLSWEEAIAHFFEKLGEASFWIRALKFILGVGLIVIALVFFARAAGLGAITPESALTQAASRAATSSYQSQTQVSTGTRQRAETGGRRDRVLGASREKTPSAAGRRDRGLPSTRQLRKGAKRR